MLKAHAKGKHLSFHTPGHKAKGWDITELSYSDNLACPQGAILRAERDAAEILGADRSFFLTDGSTAGVLSMLYAAKRLGARSVAFPENAHKSVYNGCKLLGLRPVLLSVPRWRFVTLQPPRGELTAKIGGADALLLVSPDYYGNLARSGVCAAAVRRVGQTPSRRRRARRASAFRREDLCRDVCRPVGGRRAQEPARADPGRRRIRPRPRAFGGSRGGGRHIPHQQPLLSRARVRRICAEISRNERLEERAFRFAARFPGRVYTGGDWTKITALFGRRAFDAEKYLESKGIYAEFCDGDGVMFYLSPATKMRELAALERALSKMFPPRNGRTSRRRNRPLPPLRSVRKPPLPLPLRGAWKMPSSNTCPCRRRSESPPRGRADCSRPACRSYRRASG